VEKGYGYIRVSGRGQIEGDGFRRQTESIQAFARANDIKIVKIFRDGGISGSTENMDRPAWRELIAALHGNGVRIVLIEKLDRLARNLMVQEAAIAHLQKNGFTLRSAHEPDLMATDPTRVLLRQLLGAVAQYEKSQIVAKLKGARIRIKAATGRCEGRKSFGHYSGEEGALQRMIELRASGLGFDRIAAQLNNEQVPTRTGRRWHGVVVNRILSSKSSAMRIEKLFL
jgi:DNA invertase Pin-like site-specific DNA recombinase